MGKLAPARVSYRDDFVILQHVYMMTGSFHTMFTWKLNADEAILDWQKLRMRYLFQSTCKPISHRNEWSFRFYIIPLRNIVPEWNSRPGARTGVNSRQHDILWWYHVDKCRAMRGNRSELALTRKSPRCHVNNPLEGAMRHVGYLSSHIQRALVE